MASRTIEDVDIDVDAEVLASLGWTSASVRARLVTTTFARSDHAQEVVLSGELHFDPPGAFERFDDGVRAPALVLALNRRDSTLPPMLSRISFARSRTAAKRAVRVSTSEAWTCRSPVTPDLLTVRLVAYDLEDLDGEVVAPLRRARRVPVRVVDDTDLLSVSARVATASAFVFPTEDVERLRVHLDGWYRFGTFEELRTDHLVGQLREGSSRGRDAADVAFEVALPGFEVEVLDATGFILVSRSIELHGRVPVGRDTTLPTRLPRWVVQDEWDVTGLAGSPARVTVRVVDADDL